MQSMLGKQRCHKKKKKCGDDFDLSVRLSDGQQVLCAQCYQTTA